MPPLNSDSDPSLAQWQPVDQSFDLDVEAPETIGILIAEPDSLLQQFLGEILSVEPGFRVVGGVLRGEHVAAEVERSRPNVLLLDLGLPDRDALRVIEELEGRSDPPKVLVLSGDEREETQLKTARAGAHGFIGKSVAKASLTKAIQTIASGEVWFSRRVVGLIFNEYPTLVRRAKAQEGPISLLSDREREVLLRVARGLTNKQIADELYMSISTVKSHIRSVFQKLDLSSRTEAAIFAVREGLEEKLTRPND